MRQTAQAAAIASNHLDEDAAWRQLVVRDKSAAFFYGVATTGVYCRVGCGSRPPLRRNVCFFSTPQAAQAAGFRPCARCKPDAVNSSLLDVSSKSISTIRRHIEQNLDRAVPLAELGRIASMSPFTVQRAFKQAMGASPLQYQRALRAARMRGTLKDGGSVTSAVYEAGFGSASRAYEGATMGMTPGRFAKGGKGERISYATAQTPFGWMIVGATERGLCWLALGSTKAEAEASLRDEFPLASLAEDSAMKDWVGRAMESVRDGSDLGHSRNHPDKLDLRGTVFQLRVWQALRQIPRGETRSYSELARQMDEPNATRAVARACATNRVAVLVPCHRVVGASGSLTGYRWGVERKQQLLAAERV
jgi:AraC family transcriptional regulator of adaptative response/methylated-DNA-[protein]-cysteine methyltransferase